MKPGAAVLRILSDPALAGDADRVAAVAGLRTVPVASVNRRTWLTATAVLLDESGARQCCADGMPRRDWVALLAGGELATSTWAAAIDIGAHRVYTLPDQDTELVRMLSDAAQSATAATEPGRAVAVLAGRGGAGASVFAAALAQAAEPALLIDLDPAAGGNDLVMGVESDAGLRWPDLIAHEGRLEWSAVREVLPGRGGVSVLSCSRTHHDIDAAQVQAVIDAGRRGGVTIVCDVPRHLSASALCALELADLVVVVTTCDIRGLTGAVALSGLIRPVNPYVALVVRGPSPGGMSADEAVGVVGLPLLAAMRPEPMLAQRLEEGGLRLRRRSPLTYATRAVLDALTTGRGAR